MILVIPFEGRVRTTLRSSFVSAKKELEAHYSLSGESFQMSGVTDQQVLILPDGAEISEGQEVTDDLLAQVLPIEQFITISKEEAQTEMMALLLRNAVADGKITNEELLHIAPALQERQWKAGISVAVGDVFSFNHELWKCVQAHTTQSDWLPDSVPALWHKVEIVHEDENRDDNDNGKAVRIWSENVEYAVGDEVFYPDENGQRYICQQAHTSLSGWNPPAVPALWKAE